MSCPGYVPRRSLCPADVSVEPLQTTDHDPGDPSPFTGAVRKTPWYGRGDVMSAPRHGAVSDSYATYIRSPLGEIAGAEYIGRSPPSETVRGLAQVAPPSRDQL